MKSQKETNRLIHSSSPYLLQHAYNPVDWYPWGNEALERAKIEDKPIIVSIGYSACHWCHVMERESFENEQIAEIMNKHFVCIKVDREERPDIDQIYMEAVHLMGMQGGWPLNVILMPDAKPFYGGTYFPPQNWVNMLTQVAKAYQLQKEQLASSAQSFADSLNRSDVERYNMRHVETDYQLESLHLMYSKFAEKFDIQKGGMAKAPKFPMPCIYTFLLRYYHLSSNEEALQQVKLTLNEMAYGGIYDQIGGGFARYSVDSDWFAPHFEKMLYDNGQLMSLYAEAYRITQDANYHQIIDETISFIQRELLSEAGGFYSALDADSEGIEGKFYTWKYLELESVLGDELALFKAYYSVTESGNWEEGMNILYKKESDELFALKQDIRLQELTVKVSQWKEKLLLERTKKIRPGLDNKILTSWNALMLKGLVDAFLATGIQKYLILAQDNAEFILNKMQIDDKLMHTFNHGKASIPAYLEDYAAVIEAFITLYHANFEERYLLKAKELCDYTLQHFYDEKENMFFFTDDTSEKLIARKKEIFDNVIPASNSIMAMNLFVLGTMFDLSDYQEKSQIMLSQLSEMLHKEVHYLSNWASLYTYQINPPFEVIIIGSEAIEMALELQKIHFIPHKVVMATTSLEGSELPLFEGKTALNGQTTLYVCRNKTCQLPVYSIDDAVKQMM